MNRFTYYKYDTTKMSIKYYWNRTRPHGPCLPCSPPAFFMWKKFVCSVAQLYLTLCDPLDYSPLGSSVHGISRQVYWSVLPFPSPKDLPDPGIEPTSSVAPTLQEKHSVQFSSVAQLCTTLCDPMNHSTPGLPVHHQLPEFTQTLSKE